MSRESSRLFKGYRALGSVTNDVPLCVRYHKKYRENYIITCVGRAFHTYNASKLGIKRVSNNHPDLISCMAVDERHVYTGCAKEIYASKEGKEIIHTYSGHSTDVHILLPFADHLISVDESSCIKVWDIESEEIYCELPFDNATFQVSVIVHPDTYVNKILIGSKQGGVKVWNIHKNEILSHFDGWKTPVTVLEQSPAVDIVAVGLADGQIHLHDFRCNYTLLSFRQDWGAVTAISFRTDGHPMMVSGSPVGHIAVWNLEERKLQTQIRSAHTGAVSGLKCLASQPIMVTSGVDNALKMWIFDQTDGGGRLLNQRAGHAEPPLKIRFHGADGQMILSAGQDSTLRMFSTRHESSDKSLGRASYNKSKTKQSGLLLDEHMMPPVIDFHSETARQSDWDGILSCHHNEKVATTWNYNRSTMGAYKLVHPRFEDIKRHRHTVAQCVTVTSCGNFGLIGYSSGHVDVYNMQSGLHRGSYGKDTAHASTVTGVSVDALNRYTVTVGADCSVSIWKFKGKYQEPLETMKMDSVVALSEMHRESGMLALALDDCRIFIIHVDNLKGEKIFRKFAGHANSITDLAFTSDGRWLISSSMDRTVKVWNIPSGKLIDCFLVESPVKSLTMSPCGNYLATAHIDDIGIYLWSNISLYKSVPYKELPEDYVPSSVLNLPSTIRDTKGRTLKESEEEEGGSDDGGEENDPNSYKSPAQLSSELVTLFNLPASRWLNLRYLDVIKERNKPREPPKVVNVPFFIPTIPGLETKFDLSTENDPNDANSKKQQLSSTQHYSEFGRMLAEFGTTGKHGQLVERLRAMKPSATDIEIRGLSPDGGGSNALMINFMDLLICVYDSRMNFDIAEDDLSLFLKLHGEYMTSHTALLDKLHILQASRTAAVSRVQDHYNQITCITDYLRSAIL